jgi:hypothetical protein
MTIASTHQRALCEAEEFLRCRLLPEALRVWNHAERLGAAPDDCAAGRWQTYMLLGEFEAAWLESDAIRRRGLQDSHCFWRGEELTGKRVILRCLHGLGDAVQFLRYAPALRARASRLIIEVPPDLLELAPAFDGVEEVISWAEHAPAAAPEWDVQVEINELPYLFRTRVVDLPVAREYLHLPQMFRSSAKLLPSDPSSLCVGVVWASGSWNPGRSVPFDLFLPVLNTYGCEFWNLQGGEARNAWFTLEQSSRLHPAPECERSLTRMATLISQLDLVITCDTLAAHLAGALGIESWVMLEHAADWRWQHGRSDSPWYPSLRLFRQPRPGDWRTLIENLCVYLQERVPSHSSATATLNR